MTSTLSPSRPRWSAARRRWIATTALVFITIVLSLTAAIFTTLRSSKETLERYVSVWEEEVARNMLLKGDAQLFEKIRSQILDLASDVQAAGESANLLSVKGECFAEQSLNVTLYGTPAGELRVCRSFEKLILRSASSPVFAFGLLAGLLFAAWLARRASREAAEREVRDLALQVAHDIRSPVMALQIAARSKDTSGTEAKQMVESAAQRISSIADALLEKTRTEKTRNHRKSPPEQLKTIAEMKLLKQAVNDLIIEKKTVTDARVSFDLAPWRTEAGTMAMRASPEFERALSNLLQNAIDAALAKWSASSEDGAPRVQIDAFEGSREARITIRDNGIGIPKHILSTLGQDGFSHGKIDGNGLGFSSALTWAKSLGGDIEVRSLEGTGTEVRLVIPRQ